MIVVIKDIDVNVNNRNIEDDYLVHGLKDVYYKKIIKSIEEEEF